MKCPNCGREIKEEDANFCFYCGEYLKPDPTGAFKNRFADTPTNSIISSINEINGIPNDKAADERLRQIISLNENGSKSTANSSTGGYANLFGGSEINKSDAKKVVLYADDVKDENTPISFWGWMGTFAWLILPMIGWMVFAIKMLVWAFVSPNINKRNFGRAAMIVILVFLIFLGYLMSTPQYQATFQQMMQEYSNSGM